MDQDRVEKELQRMTAALHKQQQPRSQPQRQTPEPRQDVNMQPPAGVQAPGNELPTQQVVQPPAPQVNVLQPYPAVHAMPAQPFLQPGPILMPLS
jgi:hypothetical protein